MLVTAGTNPHRLRNEASFAALCGAAPVPASSGKITRHRLSRGGDRAANSALYRIALVRMSSHPQTRDYVQRQPEVVRLLAYTGLRWGVMAALRLCDFDMPRRPGERVALGHRIRRSGVEHTKDVGPALGTVPRRTG